VVFSVADILVGKILSPYGVNGVLRVQPYTEQAASLAQYPLRIDSLALPAHMAIPVTLVAVRARDLLIRHPLCSSRTVAESLGGASLYTPRASLASLEDTNDAYQSDLIGQAVEDEHGALLGHLCAFHDFGAGLLAEIEPATAPKKLTRLVPYARLEALKEGRHRLERRVWEGVG